MTHPKYGERYVCFKCGVKFYDMKRPEPFCPKCGVDQRSARKKQTAPAVKPAIKTARKDYDHDEGPEDSLDDKTRTDDDMQEIKIKTSLDPNFSQDSANEDNY